MKIKIIKKILSTLLIASGVATTPFFVSATNGGIGDSKPAAWAKNSQNELKNDIEELDEVISQLEENIQYCENDRDRKIKKIYDQIKLYSKKLNKLEKKLRSTGPRKKFKSLKTKNLLQIVDKKLKRITENLNSSRQCDDRLKKQFEFLKIKIARLLKEREFVKSEFQKNTQFEREQLRLCAINRSEKIKQSLEVLKEKASDLYERSDNLGVKFRSFSEPNKSKLNTDDRCKLLSLPNKFKKLCEKDKLNQEDINQFNSLESTFKDLQTKIDAINSVEDSQSESFEIDQAQEKLNLWKEINSGSQLYNWLKVRENLCWLYSATNVINYYSNIKNEKLIKKYKPVTEKYKEKMGVEAAKNHINGTMQDFSQISGYLEKFNLGLLKMTISTESNDKKLMEVVKDLLKTHFVESSNPSPVIIHQPNHFITIAGYDQNKDQFLIVDSWNFSLRSSDARVEWKPAQNAFHIENVGNAKTITLGFTSNSINIPSSTYLYIPNANSIIERNLFGMDQQISIDDLKDTIKNY